MISGLTVFLAAAGLAVRLHVDGATLARLKAGDPAALRLLVTRHHGAMVGLAETVVRNRAVAEEVVQETWLAVVAHISEFDGRSALSTWIIAILLNKARTYVRRESRYVELAVEAGEADEPLVPASRFKPDGHWSDPPTPFDGLDPERILAGRELWRHVGAAIETLPPAQKAVIILRDVEGRDAAEACRLLEISAENQRILLHRARAKVRNRLEELLRGEAAPAAAR